MVSFCFGRIKSALLASTDGQIQWLADCRSPAGYSTYFLSRSFAHALSREHVVISAIKSLSILFLVLEPEVRDMAGKKYCGKKKPLKSNSSRLHIARHWRPIDLPPTMGQGRREGTLGPQTIGRRRDILGRSVFSAFRLTAEIWWSLLREATLLDERWPPI
ncbi:hypothetical protein V2G26_019613 [Clonostachys chloroleuca]